MKSLVGVATSQCNLLLSQLREGWGEGRHMPAHPPVYIRGFEQEWYPEGGWLWGQEKKAQAAGRCQHRYLRRLSVPDE